MDKKIVRSNLAHASRSMGPFVRQVIPSAIDNVDPFVFLDHFGPIEKKPGGQGVPPHPHAGIATITYLFSGSNRHQDSYGHDAMIYAGDLAWMQAGKGIVHAEGMNEHRTASEIVHGLQFWISLPAKDKFIEPDFFYHPSGELPTIKIKEASVKIICGELLGNRSPVKSLSPAFIYEAKIPANESITIPIKSGDTAGIYLVSGDINVNGQHITSASITSFDREGDQITLNSNESSHLILLGGTPLDEPIVGYASYVMNKEEQIHKVMIEYQNGKMGTVTI
jgi:quercetin 2,3-dioxygenase